MRLPEAGKARHNDHRERSVVSVEAIDDSSSHTISLVHRFTILLNRDTYECLRLIIIHQSRMRYSTIINRRNMNKGSTSERKMSIC